MLPTGEQTAAKHQQQREKANMSGIAAKLAKERETARGLGSNAKAFKYLSQDFERLRNECLQAGKLFQDPSFPAIASSLGYKELGPNSHKTQGITWRRPTVGYLRDGPPGQQGGGREKGVNVKGRAKPCRCQE